MHIDVLYNTMLIFLKSCHGVISMTFPHNYNSQDDKYKYLHPDDGKHRMISRDLAVSRAQ